MSNFFEVTQKGQDMVALFTPVVYGVSHFLNQKDPQSADSPVFNGGRGIRIGKCVRGKYFLF